MTPMRLFVDYFRSVSPGVTRAQLINPHSPAQRIPPSRPPSNHPTTTMTKNSPPVVVEVTSTLGDGLYGPGHEIEILVRFSAPVVVQGVPPRLWLDLGDNDGYAEFEALSDGTDDTLVFVYVVNEGVCFVSILFFF